MVQTVKLSPLMRVNQSHMALVQVQPAPLLILGSQKTDQVLRPLPPYGRLDRLPGSRIWSDQTVVPWGVANEQKTVMFPVFRLPVPIFQKSIRMLSSFSWSGLLTQP